MTPGGFIDFLQEILSRQKITAHSFGEKTFQEQNLSGMEEAARDITLAFGMAAVFEFQNSNSFPHTDDLLKCKRTTESHYAILLEHFKKWIKSSWEDISFKYYLQKYFTQSNKQNCHTEAMAHIINFPLLQGNY